jgi:flagellar basal-body rod protein FlgB
MMRLLDAVSGLHSGLDYHLARENLLVSNLAHADTPGYVPKDATRPTGSFAGALAVAMETTDARHLGGHGHGPNLRIVNDASAGAGPDGNAVSLDREATKIASNNIRYDAIASLVGSELAGLSWAANDGRVG